MRLYARGTGMRVVAIVAASVERVSFWGYFGVGGKARSPLEPLLVWFTKKPDPLLFERPCN